MNRPQTFEKTLLVEGKDDLFVVANLCKAVGLPDQAFWIKDKEGYSNLITDLEVELAASGLKCLGILVDADTNVADRWTTLRNQLLAAGCVDVPESPDPAGFIVAQTDKQVGVWIMPDNTLPGMLEDFVAHLVPNDDVLWPRVQACLDQIPNADRRFPQQHLTKAQIHTWLAWQHQPGKPLGQAITMKYLTPGAPQVSLFVDWLRRLFQI